MELIRKEFGEKIKHAQEFVEYAEKIKENDVIKHMMYSSVVLILYNIVESTVCSLLERIHDEVISFHKKGNKYHDFTGEIKSIIYRCNCASKVGSSFNYNELYDMKMQEFKSINEYGKKQLNGNVDAKRIRELFCQYGINETKHSKQGKLKDLKEYRQRLAHGSTTFKEFGRDITDEDIRKLFYATKGTLYNTINNVELFISKKKFLIKRIK